MLPLDHPLPLAEHSTLPIVYFYQTTLC